MFTPRKVHLSTLAMIVAVASASPPVGAANMGTAFTYQGRLVKNGAPVGSPAAVVCNLTFRLYDDATGGDQVGLSPQGPFAVTIDRGLFTQHLDFGGSAINGDARWLEIAVQCPGDAMPRVLPPRQELKPAPHALALPGLYTQQNNTSPPNLIGGFNGNSVSPGKVGATIAGGGSSVTPNRVMGDYGTVGGGVANNASGNLSTVGGGDGNTARGANSTIGGGQRNTANGEDSTIGGGKMNTSEAGFSTVSGGHENNASGYASIIGGGSGNTASGYKSVISGGNNNAATGFHSTVAGGSHNYATASFGTIVGGGPSHPEDDPAATNNRVYDAYGSIGGGGFNRAGSDDGNQGSSQFATIGGGVRNEARGRGSVVGGGRFNYASGNDSVVGGGYYNHATADFATIAGGGPSDPDVDPTTSNSVYDNYGTVGGGGRNTAGSNDGDLVSGQYATIGGGYFNIASGAHSSVGGGQGNSAMGKYATIAGGGPLNPDDDPRETSNSVYDDYGTVGGGGYNSAGSDDGETFSARCATVNGGCVNQASGSYSAVGGGDINIASGEGSSVGGGFQNTASGEFSTVPGGRLNQGGGAYSFAAGRRAKVRTPAQVGVGNTGDQGTFVWADSANADFQSTGSNQFLVRASGGIYLGANNTVNIHADQFINTSTGGYLTLGGTWTNSSDRDMKENIRPIDPNDVLSRVLSMPVARWKYREEGDSIEHIGPMAQDFHAAFGLGDSDKSIATIDADGVAFAAIQGLYEVVQDKDCRIEELEDQNAELHARLAALEALVGKLVSPHNGGGR